MTDTTTGAVIGPHGHDYSRLARCLKRFGDEEVIYIPNKGNAGDALIALGTFLFFDAIGLRYRVGERGESYPGRVVVFAGGGALVDVYPNSDAVLRRNHAVCKALIVLPHSVRAYPGLLAELDERCTIFSREQPTNAYLRAHCTRAVVDHCHDLAFFASEADIIAEPWDAALLLEPTRRLSWLKMFLKFAAVSRFRTSTLNIFREDSEKTDVPLPAYNFDLSRYFTVGDMSRRCSAQAVKMARLTMRQFATVRSNRLHMAVLGGILGKDVAMYDNSYGKNSSIFVESIGDYFPNVTFIDSGAPRG